MSSGNPKLDKMLEEVNEFYSGISYDDEKPAKDADIDAVSDKTGSITKRENVNPEAGEKKYGDVRFADPKNHKYPLDTPEHVRSAASYFGMTKNSSKYSEEEQTTIRKRIRAAEKKFNIGAHSDAEGK